MSSVDVADITAPHRYHRDQLSARQALEANLEKSDTRLSQARLATVLAAVAVAGGAWWQGWFSAWWLTVPSATFVALVVVHDRVIRARRVATRAVQWYEHGLARIEDRWVGLGETGERFQDEDHPYALDLDLFGEGSLFQLLTTAQTASGEETLSRWLLSGSDPHTVRLRQKAVQDLAGRPRLREDLFMLGADVRAGVDSPSLVGWATGPPILSTGWLRIAIGLLSVAVVVAIGTWVAGLVPAVVPLVMLLVNGVFGINFHRSASRVLHGASAPSRELEIFAGIVERVHDESFAADRLRQLHAALGLDDKDPVAAVHRLSWLIQMHDWQHNMMFAPVAAVLLWGLQCAMAVEAWRARHGRLVPTWLEAVGEIEALASLATYHFEHPDDPFPELVEGVDTLAYEAEGVRHPILPRASAVANDVCLGVEPQLLVVSGSNMSGKTTLLRTVGVNGVLALAGAPVRARRLRLTPLTIGATLRVQDSLLAGRSRFYAEITRLRLLVDMAKGSRPLLFLLDELFHGTNSLDRVEGAHGVLHSLLGLGAVGLVTTHDLALATIADRLTPKATNVHFEDHFADGEIAFDYQLRRGRATQSNALALMKAVGLDVSVPPASRQR